MSQGEVVIKLPKEAWPHPEELPPNMRLIAETIGMENLMKLYEVIGENHVYFGGYGRFLNRHRDQKIRLKYDQLIKSMSCRAAVAILARENDISDRWVWEITGRPDERQLGMWTK